MFDYLAESIFISFCIGGIAGAIIALHLSTRNTVATTARAGELPVKTNDRSTQR
ncbi:MAG: hypothetical protein HY940_09440 [Gammaproteobacteria bacterium]|nr:hypothetical protein [Gammaproteobacteria bacterium]